MHRICGFSPQTYFIVDTAAPKQEPRRLPANSCCQSRLFECKHTAKQRVSCKISSLHWPGRLCTLQSSPLPPARWVGEVWHVLPRRFFFSLVILYYFLFFYTLTAPQAPSLTGISLGEQNVVACVFAARQATPQAAC